MPNSPEWYREQSMKYALGTATTSIPSAVDETVRAINNRKVTGIKKAWLKTTARVNCHRLTRHEAILKHHLDNAFPGVFYPQWVIGEFIVDFFSPLINMVIEVDGASHNGIRGQFSDALKEALYSDRTMRILRVTNQEVEADCDSVIGRVRAAILEIPIAKCRRKGTFGFTFSGLPAEVVDPCHPNRTEGKRKAMREKATRVVRRWK